MDERIFGMTREEISRQCVADTLMCDSNSPIRIDEFKNPCIEGGEKILADEKSKEFFRRIYTGSDSDE